MRREDTMKKASMLALLLALSLPVMARHAEARVVRLVVEKTQPFAGGKTFGAAGEFERLDGTVYFEVDPKDPLNALIVNLDRVHRNAKGLVEFSAPFFIVKPKDMTRGNRKIFYGINNRGNNIEFGHTTWPTLSPGTPPESGDILALRLGYAYVDAGWAGDVETTANRLGANLPVAVQPDGRPIVAPIRIEYSGTGFTLPLKGNDRFRTYEAADTTTARATLTVRDAVSGPRKTIAADRWAFGKCPSGKESLVPTTTDLCLFDQFQADRIYELTYQAKNPTVMGLGYAVTRDLASFLRYSVKDDAGNVNPLAQDASTVGIRRAYAFGSSSTGMYLRDYLYLGFNEDEGHRKVFDAVRIAIPGTHRLFANVEFADPNIYSRQDDHHDFVSYSHPPLTYAVTTDPISGVRDGILKRPATDPLVMQIDTGNEFWQMNASLNVHDGAGKPVPLPDNVRMYFAASHSHTGATGLAARPTAKGICEYPVSGARSHDSLLRALMVALDDWADRGISPPKSVYPDRKNGALVSVEEASKAFPKIPGVTFPTVVNQAALLNHGPAFSSMGGRLTILPPTAGATYLALVPKPDADGHDLGGIRTVEIAVPVGTNLGWNLRAAGHRGTDLCGLSGGFIALANTKAERLAKGDPRLSLEERYRDHDGFVAAVERATRRLVQDRFLLEEDAQDAVKVAKASDILR
jgi:alpha/beta hydrolase family protein